MQLKDDELLYRKNRKINPVDSDDATGEATVVPSAWKKVIFTQSERKEIIIMLNRKKFIITLPKSQEKKLRKTMRN